MADFLAASYLWIKALHIASVISWMAGLFYLPRLFVYHVEQGADHRERAEMLEIMEEKLLRIIMNPAMIASWVFGLLLAVILGWSGHRLGLVPGEDRLSSGDDRISHVARARTERPYR